MKNSQGNYDFSKTVQSFIKDMKVKVKTGDSCLSRAALSSIKEELCSRLGVLTGFPLTSIREQLCFSSKARTRRLSRERQAPPTLVNLNSCEYFTDRFPTPSSYPLALALALAPALELKLQLYRSSSFSSHPARLNLLSLLLMNSTAATQLAGGRHNCGRLRSKMPATTVIYLYLEIW